MAREHKANQRKTFAIMSSLSVVVFLSLVFTLVPLNQEAHADSFSAFPSASGTSRQLAQIGTTCGAVFAFLPIQAAVSIPASTLNAECNSRAYYEFDTSTIPDGSTITDVDLRIFPQFTGTNAIIDCRITQMQFQPSLQTIQTRFDDINNGTIYDLDANAWCRFAGVAGQIIDLGPTADADLEGNLVNDWFAVGRQYSSETRDALPHSSTRWGSVELVVTFTPPPQSCNGIEATIVGTSGDDVIIGTPGDDVISGLEGNDIIYGLGGNDTICGNEGNDFVRAGTGDDFVRGDGGKDVLLGDEGNDEVRGNAGDDRLVGGSGEDKLRGGNGNDVLVGGTEDDDLDGNNDTDFCDISDPTDTIANCETTT